MVKHVHLAFTGVVILTPSSGGGGQPSAGPFYAIMPNSPRARRAPSEPRVQIDAHHPFALFSLDQLLFGDQLRSPDTKHPIGQPEKGVCLFYRESMTVNPPPNNTQVTYQTDSAPPDTTQPPGGSSDYRWIGDWKEVSKGRALLDAGVITQPGNYVTLEIPGCHVSARFPCPTSPRARFTYDDLVIGPRFFAQEMVATLEYDDSVPEFTISSKGEDGSALPQLKFTWGTSDRIDISIGNGPMESIDALLTTPCAGHEHVSAFDHEFEIMYDVVTCPADSNGRKPIPFVTAGEVRHIDCFGMIIPFPSTIERPERMSTEAFSDTDEFLIRKSVSRADLERVREIFALPADFNPGSAINPLPTVLNRVTEASNRVCRFTVPGDGSNFGTGFLIAEDLVMTAAHLFFDENGTISFRSAAGTRVEFQSLHSGALGIVVGDTETVGFAEQGWIVANGFDGRGQRLDYVIVKLAKSVGRDRLGRSGRGWFQLPAQGQAPVLREDVMVHILQYVDRNVVNHSVGSIRSVSPDRSVVEYSASTLDAASGSAVLNDSFALAALHISGPDRPGTRRNRGLPIGRVVANLAERQLLEQVLRPRPAEG